MKICAVIVTYNRRDEVAFTVTALVEQGIAPVDILVIDNASLDDTPRMLEEKFSGIQVVTLSENLSAAGGFAAGMKIAFERGYDWLWLFNDDARPLPGALPSARGYLTDQDGSPGMLCISHIEKNGKVALLYWNGYRKPKYVLPDAKPVATDLVTFNGCFLSRKVIERIGTCDPAFFMGMYEFDYCLRATDAGFRILTLPNGLLEDGKIGSASGTPPWRQYYNSRNHLWLGLKRRSLRIIFGWTYREAKYLVWILLFSDRKMETIKFKLMAFRDAILGRRGARVSPPSTLTAS